MQKLRMRTFSAASVRGRKHFQNKTVMIIQIAGVRKQNPREGTETMPITSRYDTTTKFENKIPVRGRKRWAATDSIKPLARAFENKIPVRGRKLFLLFSKCAILYSKENHRSEEGSG